MGKPRNTRKYPKEKKIPRNTRSYFSTLLPDPTCYPVFCSIPDPTRPDAEKPYPLGTANDQEPVAHPICAICNTLGDQNAHHQVELPIMYLNN